jgi:hypothetical protein
LAFRNLPDEMKARIGALTWALVSLCAVLVVGSLCAILILNAIVSGKVTAEMASAHATATPSPGPAVYADLGAFEAHPYVAEWSRLQQDIADGSFDHLIETRIVNVLVTQNLSAPLTNAVVAQLSSLDQAGTLRLLHGINALAQINPGPNAPQIVSRSSKVTWMLLALRSGYDTAGIDLTRMDLRDGGSFVGQGMNLTSVDFSNSELTGGEWHQSNLTFTSFSGVRLTRPLTCTGCTWGNLRISGRVPLSDDRWSLP